MFPNEMPYSYLITMIPMLCSAVLKTFTHKEAKFGVFQSFEA